jgi:hypothetical protein
MQVYGSNFLPNALWAVMHDEIIKFKAKQRQLHGIEENEAKGTHL